jgi:hypothetical protein
LYILSHQVAQFSVLFIALPSLFPGHTSPNVDWEVTSRVA